MKRVPKIRRDYTTWTLEQHIEHLRTHEPYQAHYKNYDPRSIETFIKNYAEKKHDMFQHFDEYKKSYETHQMQFLTLAEGYITMILQKKLFNLQCQWRAGLIELPLVTISKDFEYWESDVRNCPFIPPVTQEEVDLCYRFLLERFDFSELMNDDPYASTWQNYHAFKNQLKRAENEERAKDGDTLYTFNRWDEFESLPGLYTFFDKHQQTEALLILPDVRGQKEDVYSKKGLEVLKKREEDQLKAAGEWKEPEPRPPYKYIPDLCAYGRDLQTFIGDVEDEETKEIYKYQLYQYKIASRYVSRWDNEDEMDKYINFLREFDEPIPLEANDTWEGAIICGVKKFKQKKAAEMLAYAYDTYLMEFDADQPLDQLIAQRVANYQYPDKDKSNIIWSINQYKERILAGREALDGRSDFDY